MITKTKQNWTIGQTVKIGFMSLVVKAAVATPGDYLPDAYILTNVAGTQLYKFVPHNGVQKIDVDEARIIVSEAKRAEAMKAKTAVDQLIACCKASAEIEMLFA